MKIRGFLLSALLSQVLAVMATAQLRAKEVVIYSTNPPAALAAAEAAIRRDHGHDSRFVAGGSAVLLDMIRRDGAQSRADLMWSSSISTLGAFPGLFTPYDAPALADVFPHLRDPDNMFLPSNINVITLMVNRAQLGGRPVPTSWKALTDPVWRGQVLVADPANSSTSYAALYGLSKLLSPADYRALVANMVVSDFSAAVPLAVAAGTYPVGVTFEANSYFYVAAGLDRFNVIYPADGTFITTDYAAVVKTAPSPEAAFRAVDAILGRDAQVALLTRAYRRPSRMDIRVSDHVNLPELGDILVAPLNEVEAAADRPRFLAEWAALPKAGRAEMDSADGED